MKRKICKFILTFSLVLALPQASLAQADYDLVIKNGQVFNPSTNTQLDNYNIGIKDGKIKRISRENLEAREVIDARGKIVSPGFIDLISYDPNPYGISFKVLEGVTSNLAMHGGTEDAKTWYDKWEEEGVMTNFGASTFITRLRWPLIGGGVDDEIEDEKDIKELVRLSQENIEKGALGLSFSLEYVPGIKNEIIPLLQMAKELGAPSFYHLRYSDKEGGLEGVREVIDYSRETGASVHLMHLNSTGGTFNMKAALDLINQGKKEGLDISSCIYPYDYWATYIDSARFREGWQERFNIDYEDLQVGGSDIRLTKESFPNYREKRILVAAHNSIPEDANILALKDPAVMIGSDTIIEDGGNNHPRGSGSYGRLFSHYVRESQLLTIMEAIEKASYLPAKRMEDIAPQMKYKGRIEVEADADLLVFDLDSFKDQSSIKETELASTGMDYVLINGQMVKSPQGLEEDLKPGRPIKSKFVDSYEERDRLDISLVYGEKTGDLAAYKIDKETYLPLTKTFDFLDLDYRIGQDGRIDLGKSLSFKLGDLSYRSLNQDYRMPLEAIIYEGDFYLPLPSLEHILRDYLDLTENGQLIFTAREKSKLIQKKDPDQVEEKSPISKPLPVYFGICLVLAYFLVRLIKKRRRK